MAYDYLVKEGRLNPEMFRDFSIKATHNYLKLKPATIEEEDLILADTTYIALDYPLDVDLPESYFERRGELAEGVIPEYYTSVKLGAKIAYNGTTEIIETMYVPEEDPYFKDVDEDYKEGTTLITTRAQLHDELLYTAYFLKGLENILIPEQNAAKGSDIEDNKTQKPVLTEVNQSFVLDKESEERYKEEIIIKPNWIFGKKWWPSGSLRYVDTSFPSGQQNKALPGAQVLIRQGVTLHNAITNSSGNFSMGSVRGHARYIIQWERDRYNIKNHSGWQAELRGPHQRSPWHHTIQANHDEDVYHTLIHLACLDYYYGDRFGLTAPKKNIRIAARQTSEGRPNHVAARGIFYQISIKRWEDIHCDIYGTTIHELAHSAHREVTPGGYDAAVMDGYINILNPNPNAKRLIETWATTVELLFVQQRYNVNQNTLNNTDILLNDYRQLMQNIEVGFAEGQQKYYTSCGFDMIDSHNQRSGININNMNLPIDRVSGYTPKQLEESLKNIASWNAWKNSIKSNYNNPTENNLDELFANW